MARLAIAMWEFSWLVRRSGNQAEYADWDRVLDEFQERGYNCIRLDAFPHLVASGPDGARRREATILAQDAAFPWGNHSAVRVEPCAGLLEFLGKMRDRGLKAGLSTWLNDDTDHCRESVGTPSDFQAIWTAVLELLEENSLLEAIEWVDLCNEFPMSFWCPAAYRQIFGDAPTDPLKMMSFLSQPWTEEQRLRASAYLTKPIAVLKNRFPGLRFTYSVAGPCAANFVALDLSKFGLLEPHVWLSDDAAWAAASGQTEAGQGIRGALQRHHEIMAAAYPLQKASYKSILDELMSFWTDAAARTGLPLITSEGWGPIFYDDLTPGGAGGEWEWVKDLNALAISMAVERGWEGVCTSNFCQPHFHGMWRDVAWHKEMTQEILR